MQKQANTPLTKGNAALRAGDYQEAIEQYVQSLLATPDFAKVITGNLAMARRKYRASRQGLEKQRVAVCGWELSHNAAGRVYTLAMLYEAFAEVEIIGSHFPGWGRQVWAPIRDTAIAKHSFVVEDETAFISQAIQLVIAYPYDIVHLSKPRAPNIFFGLLYKLIWDAKVLVDIDDEELAFVGEETPISVEDYLKQNGSLPELKDLAGKAWTRLAVGLAKEFDGITVCNTVLQQRYGGEVIPHARDEKLFQPSPELKRQSREKYGIPQDKKVVLFFGTPREHKGLIETAQAIARLKRKDVLFCVVGSFIEAAFKEKLQAVVGCQFVFLPDQSFAAIPEIVSMADCVVCLQDEKSVVSQYQMPAKISDALAARVPVVVNPLAMFAELIDFGVVVSASGDLSESVNLVLFDGELIGKVKAATDQYFCRMLSSSVIWPDLLNYTTSLASRSILNGALPDFVLENILSARIALPRDAERFFDGKAVTLLPQVDRSRGCLPDLDLDEVMRLIGESGYFDSLYYLAENLDVASNKKINPLSHFARKGLSELRSPSAKFDTKWYVNTYSEVREAGVNPLVHYLLVGRGKGFAALDPRVNKILWWERFSANPPKDVLGFVGEALHRASVNQMPVAIIVPVYNALAELKNLIASLIRHTKYKHRIILVDDASPDPSVAPYLRSLAGLNGIEVYFNGENRGFSATVNFGIDVAGGADVVVLNSDAIVTPMWLNSLRLAAYSAEKIGTVTPLSNNAGPYSTPNFGKENLIPGGYDLDKWSRMVRQVSARQHVKTPTAHGFCMYIRRDCITEVGKLDQEAFPKGYGEENDFCMRALRKGWSHVIDSSTYIYHVRSASFGNSKDELLKAGRAVVDKRYPEYTGMVRAFVKQEDFLRIHSVVSQAENLAREADVLVRPRILYVLATKTGGTPQTNQDLMAALGDRYETFVLYSNGRKVDLCHYSDGVYRNIESCVLDEEIFVSPHRSEQYDNVLADWLVRYSIEMLHIRHIAWHGFGVVDVANKIGIPIVFSFHDFYTVCPTVKLLDDAGNFCGGLCTDSSGDCKYDLWRGSNFPPLKKSYVYTWRDSLGVLLNKCSAFITTSETARNVLVKNYPFLNHRCFSVIPHGRDFDRFGTVDEDINAGNALKLLFPGNITPAKGGSIISELAARSKELGIEVHLLGKVAGNVNTAGCVLHGEYGRDNFVDIVADIKPHISCIFSIWPETHCHTLTESWAAGLPVIGFNIGAVGDRLGRTKAGWLVDEFNSEAVVSILRAIIADSQLYRKAVDNVRTWQMIDAKRESCAEMAVAYEAIYKQFL